LFSQGFVLGAPAGAHHIAAGRYVVGPPPPHRGPGTLEDKSAFPSPWPNSAIRDTNFRAPGNAGNTASCAFLVLGPVSERPEIRTIRAARLRRAGIPVPLRLLPIMGGSHHMDPMDDPNVVIHGIYVVGTPPPHRFGCKGEKAKEALGWKASINQLIEIPCAARQAHF